ncbi:hypothetical protein B484DRAFT_89284 [Ochromonadaceae sp. CCMP2298]|nr:hypothetical protein B484DRAFT_89284 [Ochromonadaceae sp. CCMP2298]
MTLPLYHSTTQVTHPRHETLLYDDEEVLLVQDFYHINPGTLYTEYFFTPLSQGAEPMPTSILVNGQTALDLQRDRYCAYCNK